MIRILEKQVADKIAAGEVVERPLSIVKELIENSIDSGANSIICEIKNGGKLYIRVTDNGCGIQNSEVETAFLRHATSKITQVADLDCLETLGFRGEALASIAAVSRVQLLTKVADEKVGTDLIIHGGQVVSTKATGCPNGTTIVVNDVFYNTPARLKFLKNDGAEGSAVIEFISQIALAFSNIKFRMINNGKIVFSTNGNGNRLNTIASIYPNIDIKNLVPVYNEEDGYNLDGFISTPAMSKPTRNSQVFFVNGRVIESKVIEKGLVNGYKERLFEGRHPVAFLFLTTPANSLDVNIHPNKRQVRFNNEAKVIEFITNTVVMGLGTKEAVVRAGNIFKYKESEVKTTDEARNTAAKPTLEQIHVYNSEVLNIEGKKIKDIEENKDHSEEKHKQVDIKELLSTNQGKEETVHEDVEILKEQGIIIDKPSNIPFDFQELNYFGTIFDTYILATDENSFYMLDQHACHERINYEKFVGQYNQSEKLRQPIMFPFIVNVDFKTNSDANWINALSKMGFAIEEFGFDSFRVTEIPTFMTIGEAESFVNDFIDNIKDDNQLSNTVVIDKLIMKSCKASIKANDKISMDEIKELMRQLAKCRNPFSCPHGRPTFIKMTKYEIEKIFKRV